MEGLGALVGEAVFWGASALIAYTYVAYPAVVALLARLRGAPIHAVAVRPTASLLIVAHNEARHLRQTLDNRLALDYPKDRLEIVVASDGSSDETVEIAQQYAGAGVVTVAFETRRGKPSVLNEVIPQCRGDIVALSDARQLYDPGALSVMLANFADPKVGAVSGELHLANEGGVGVGEGVGFYWRYEKFIRRHESRFDSTVGATGAIYAIRRELFETVPADTILDDVLIPMRIARQGYRVVFEPGALAFDRVSETASQEFTRKVRTIAGTLQLLARERWLWNPLTNRLWFQTMSHKLLRIVGAPLLLAAFSASGWLARSSPLLRVAFVGQLVFYAAACLGFSTRRRTVIGRGLAVPYAFCVLNAAALVGMFRFLTGGQPVTWQKTSADLTTHRPRAHADGG
jgi:poly-beta-1,6-N-acetyl-D-glucosamine synthase